MSVQNVKRMLRYRQWAAQINDRQQSGQTVRQWCEAQGICVKTYYHRLKRVREEMLDALESPQHPGWIATATEGIKPSSALRNSLKEIPSFAALPMPQIKEAAVSVRIGGYTVDIQNGAAGTLVEQVIRLVAVL